MTGPAAGVCPYDYPASSTDAAVRRGRDDEYGRPTYRAICDCGRVVAGYLTMPDAWKALDRHRADAVNIRALAAAPPPKLKRARP